MIITRLERERNNSKIRIYIDDIYAFSLYPKEITKNAIEENVEIEQDVVRKLTEIVFKRARAYAYNLLSRREYTAAELFNKIQKSGITINLAEIIVGELEKRGYVNDERFVQRYIENMAGKKSINTIKYVLKNKGIDNEILERTISYNQEQEKQGIIKILEKKIKNIEEFDGVVKEKLIRHLLYKGFSYLDIQKVLDEYYKQ